MSAEPFPLLIKYLLGNAVRQHPRQEIVYRGERRLTYRHLGERVARLGAALAALGVRPGMTVAVMDWDSHRYLECFFAVPMSGAVLMTVNIRLSPDQILYTLNHAGADIVLCHTDFAPILAELKPNLTHAKTFVPLTDGAPAPPGLPWTDGYEALLAAADPVHTFEDFDEHARATTFYTTGTTGAPKGVYFSHRQIVLHTLVSMGAIGLSPRDVYMPITPMFHVHAWGNPFTTTALGMKQVYCGRYDPALLVRLYRDEGVTFSHCVPTILQMFLDASAGVDLSGWRVIIGGAAMPRALARAALDRGVDVFSGYGMSETGPMMTLALPDPALWDGGETELTYRCRAGRPMPMVQVRIVDEAMRDLPQDGRSAGEIVVRSPWLTAGYLKDAEASARLWRGGWLHTGDIGTIDEHGYLAITDRIKDVIKTGGEWVSSLALEDRLATHPSVAEVAVIGVPCPRWSERPAAIVVLRPGAEAEADALRAHLMADVAAGALSKYAVPDRIEFTSALPRTSVGKIDKKALRAVYAG